MACLGTAKRHRHQGITRIALLCAVLCAPACGGGAEGRAGGGADSGGNSAQAGTGGAAQTGSAGSRQANDGAEQGGAAGSGASTAGVNLDPILEQACERRSAARCDKYAECDPVVYDNAYPDRETCVVLETANCARSLGEATSTDEASLDSCAEQVAELACAEWLMNPAIDGCTPTGTLAADADCENDGDCASGVCYTASCREPGAEGEPCATGPRPCQNGLLCAQQVADEGTSATCQQQLEVGDPCDGDLSACPHPTVCLEGTCREPVMGTPCVDGRICGSRWRIGTCDTGNCSGACDGVCAPFTLVGNGDTCGQHLLCDATTYCSLGHLNFKGICQPRVEVGGSCEGEFNVLPPQCVAGARCGDGFICVSSL